MRAAAKRPAHDINRAKRVELAIAMRIRGCEWQEIAEACGLKGGRASAYNLVNGVLKEYQREASDELRNLELMRLDKLLDAIWPLATQQLALAGEDGEDGGGKRKRGDGPSLWAVDRCLAIMERRAKLLGLDTPPAQTSMVGQVLIRTYGADTDAV